nr:transposase [Microtetraspora niveoalba]
MFIQTGTTNAGSEGTDRVLKTVSRDAYGFRNPENQRLRTRCATTRRKQRMSRPRLTSRSHHRTVHPASFASGASGWNNSLARPGRAGALQTGSRAAIWVCGEMGQL